MPAIFFLVTGGIILTIGDIVFKFYAETSKSGLYVIGLITYVIGLMCLIQTFKTEHIATASAIFVIANVITLLLVSYFYFHETLTVLQMIGMVLALISIAFLELGK